MNIERSPTKSNGSSLFKRIRVSVLSKCLPPDFFPQSFSQSPKRNQTNSSGGSPILVLKKLRSQSPFVIQNNCSNNNSTKEIKGLRKKLIELKKICQKQYNISSQQAIKLFDRKPRSKQSGKKIISEQKVKSSQKTKTSLKKKQISAKSKHIESYMKKMNQMIDINIKFEEDDLFNPERKYSNIQKAQKQNLSYKNSQIQTRPRAKSERTSRQKFQSLSKIKKMQAKIVPVPEFKMIKVQNSLKNSNIIKKNGSNRYNQFVNMNLEEDGMFTFYRRDKIQSPQSKKNINPKKCKVRLSLPKLEQKQ